MTEQENSGNKTMIDRGGPSKISVTSVSQSVDKTLALKLMLQTPITLVPKLACHQQLSNHVCHDIGTSYSFA